jgi:hypothetical protein
VICNGRLHNRILRSSHGDSDDVVKKVTNIVLSKLFCNNYCHYYTCLIDDLVLLDTPRSHQDSIDKDNQQDELDL